VGNGQFCSSPAKAVQLLSSSAKVPSAANATWLRPVGTLTAKTTEAESRIKALTIDGPVNDLCESISLAPQALRSALEADYKIEMRENVLTLLNASDGQQAMHEGKPVPVQADAIKNLLLGTKDAEKAKLYRAIVVVNKASGAAGAQSQRAVAPAPKHRFGLR